MQYCRSFLLCIVIIQSFNIYGMKNTIRELQGKVESLITHAKVWINGENNLRIKPIESLLPYLGSDIQVIIAHQLDSSSLSHFACCCKHIHNNLNQESRAFKYADFKNGSYIPLKGIKDRLAYNRALINKCIQSTPHQIKNNELVPLFNHELVDKHYI